MLSKVIVFRLKNTKNLALPISCLYQGGSYHHSNSTFPVVLFKWYIKSKYRNLGSIGSRKYGNFKTKFNFKATQKEKKSPSFKKGKTGQQIV